MRCGTQNGRRLVPPKPSKARWIIVWFPSIVEAGRLGICTGSEETQGRKRKADPTKKDDRPKSRPKIPAKKTPIEMGFFTNEELAAKRAADEEAKKESDSMMAEDSWRGQEDEEIMKVRSSMELGLKILRILEKCRPFCEVEAGEPLTLPQIAL
ncbi:hypothetical protein R1flu_004197 [Riccia fluitans]|uniref:Uncharacterized protein n=1 Tax=Riccia fluitans TaxID=41844 RepID=A0ABD1YPK7_9MARC